MIGKTVSHYEITEQLGRGGMGIVYKAVDTKLKRPVALKFLPSHLSTDTDAKNRFIQEAQAASALDHANICTIYEIGETSEPGKDPEVYIAMAYYGGQTLKYRLESDDFTPERAADIARQLASALGRAHEEGIVHRDVKPANIMITDRSEVKLLDFGLAKLLGGAELTHAGSTLGTAGYMSPEQVKGEDVTPASDYWSLGVVLYEMLAGKKPFTGDYEQAAMYAILNETPEDLATLIPDLPHEITDLVARCLSKDPSRPTPERGRNCKRHRRLRSGIRLGIANRHQPAGRDDIYASRVAHAGDRCRNSRGHRDRRLSPLATQHRHADHRVHHAGSGYRRVSFLRGW